MTSKITLPANCLRRETIRLVTKLNIRNNLLLGHAKLTTLTKNKKHKLQNLAKMEPATGKLYYYKKFCTIYLN